MIDTEKAVLAVIDYQERILPSIRDAEKLVENTVRLISGCRLLGVDIYMTQQYTKGLGDTIPAIREAVGQEDWIEKRRFDAADLLQQYIPKAEQKPYVILCGAESHICILQLAMGLKEAGYMPVIVADCVGSRKKSDKKFALVRALGEGIRVTTYEAVLFELLKVAEGEKFKAISNLIK